MSFQYPTFVLVIFLLVVWELIIFLLLKPNLQLRLTIGWLITSLNHWLVEFLWFIAPSPEIIYIYHSKYPARRLGILQWGSNPFFVSHAPLIINYTPLSVFAGG
jgi:hypothetical protein